MITRIRSNSFLSAIALSGLFVMGCGGSQKTETETAAATDPTTEEVAEPAPVEPAPETQAAAEPPPPAEPAPPAVTDANIAAIVVTANTIDIEAGKLAATKAKNRKVKKFAKQMVKDHTAVNKQATDLATKLNLTPEDDDNVAALKQQAETNMTNLKDLKGKEFDKAYIAHEVEYHRAVLQALDETLIPNAQNEELKALLTAVRPAFEAHLKHAEELNATLNPQAAEQQ